MWRTRARLGLCAIVAAPAWPLAWPAAPAVKVKIAHPRIAWAAIILLVIGLILAAGTAGRPSVTVMVDGRQVATIQLGLTVEFDISALVAGIKAGLLVAVHSGSCEVTATMAAQETDVLTASTHYDLPGVLAISPGIRLLPAEDYRPAASPASLPSPRYSERMS
jgi:hypothetical protein